MNHTYICIYYLPGFHILYDICNSCLIYFLFGVQGFWFAVFYILFFFNLIFFRNEASIDYCALTYLYYIIIIQHELLRTYRIILITGRFFLCHNIVNCLCLLRVTIIILLQLHILSGMTTL